MEGLNRLGQRVAEHQPLDQIFANALVTLASLLKAQRTVLLFVEGDQIAVSAAMGPGSSHLLGRALPQIGTDGLRALREGRTVHLKYEVAQARFPTLAALAGDDSQHMMVSPLRSENESRAAILVSRNQGSAFSLEEQRILQAAASWVAVALENERLSDQAKRARQGMQQLAGRLSDARHEERQRISRDLHDETGQTLVALKFNLEMVRTSLPPGYEFAHNQLIEAAHLADQTMEQIRLLAQSLYPSWLDRMCLDEALALLCEEASRRQLVKVRYRGPRGVRMNADVATALYRVAQEAVTNISKHAQADRAFMVLSISEEGALLAIRDDGRGFEAGRAVQQANGRGGHGLAGMRARMAEAGGWFRIVSTLDWGTRLLAFAPLNNRSTEPR
jgi:signal transduction histidine kinase